MVGLRPHVGMVGLRPHVGMVGLRPHVGMVGLRPHVGMVERPGVLVRQDRYVLIERITDWGEASFQPPASQDALSDAEASLGHSLPDDLARLLAESDGIDGEYGLGLLWRLGRIMTDNIRFRTHGQFRELYMPFDGLVFFADAGNGDQFGLSLSGDQEVYAWDHEDDSRTWIASSVMAYLEGWMTGKITL